MRDASILEADIFLLRHGETVWNRERRVQGHLDSPLTPLGLDQARRYGTRLKGLFGQEDGYRLVASPLGRALHTATIVAEVLGRTPDQITTDDRLKEMAWGRWDGMTAAEIEALDAELWQARIDDRWTRPPPGGGETQQDILDRATAWLGSVAADARLVVIAHGALGRAVRCAYEGLPPAAMLDLDQPQDAFFRLRGGVVTRIEV
jgi:broad specificity phosphatase PhoE